MAVFFEYEAGTDEYQRYEKMLNQVIAKAGETVHCEYPLSVNVLFTDNASIRKINCEERMIDKETDVLSFPMQEYETPADFSLIADDPFAFDPESSELLLGDIVISSEKAVSQAKEYGHSLKREIAFLTAHSMLHLFGFDHMEEEERIQMEQLQEEILKACGITREDDSEDE